MSGSPTPSSAFRTLVLVHADTDALSTWAVLEEAARDDGAEIVVVAGRSLFVFARPLEALRFCLALPERAAGCRLAAHVGGLPTDAAADPRGERMAAAIAAHELLLELIAGAAPGQRLLSRTAASLLRRAAQGHSLAMPTGWECRIGTGEGAPVALSLDPLPGQPAGAVPPGGNTRQPLPSRPHWWLEQALPPAGPLQRALLRNHKSGVRALLQVAVDAPGRERLRAQRAALRIPAVAARALEPGDGDLDSLPAFLVGELGNLTSLPEWWAGRTAPEPAERLRRVLGVAEALAACHAAGCAHGDFDLHALALADDGRIRLWGMHCVDDPAQRQRLQAADCAALARLLYGVLVGEPQRALHPFWHREVQPPAARRVIERCLDPGDPEPIHEIGTLREALQSLDSGVAGTPAAGDAPIRRHWWSPGPRR